MAQTLIASDTSGMPVADSHRYNPASRSATCPREGFALTDPGTDLAGALDQANYCIWCHKQGKDSCSKGLREKAPDGRAAFKKSPFGVTLAGCPLEEKISEFQKLKATARRSARSR
jgi:hypothetical protein